MQRYLINCYFIFTLYRNKPPQFAEYSQVNEATRIRNKQKTETRDNTDKQEEDTYAETQEGIYDKAGDRRHKENEHVEHFDSSKNLRLVMIFIPS